MRGTRPLVEQRARALQASVLLAAVALSSVSGCRPSPDGADGGGNQKAAPPSTPASSRPAPSPPSRSARRKTASSRLGAFSVERAMRHVGRLAGDVGPRLRGTRGELLAARYVGQELRRLGYEVHVQRFSVDGGVSRNVIASWPGATRYPLVVGAHLDSVAGSPGANDNASGVAVMLEIARLLTGTKQARFVELVGFGSEERGHDGRHHVGSGVYVERLNPDRRKGLAGMVSVDMVGKLLGRPLLIGTAGIGPKSLSRTLYRRVRSAGVTAAYRTTCDCSDNGPFERAGIPAAFMWSGNEPNYHSVGDTVANVSRVSIARAGLALAAFVEALDEGTLGRLRARAAA